MKLQTDLVVPGDTDDTLRHTHFTALNVETLRNQCVRDVLRSGTSWRRKLESS